MTIISTYFDYEHDGAFSRLAKTFEYSVRKHMPAANLILERQEAPPLNGVQKNRVANHEKLRWWVEQAKKQTGRFILLDTDTILLGDLNDAFTYETEEGRPLKDLALCRHKTRFYNIYSPPDENGKQTLMQELYIAPFNGGAVYCNPTEQTFSLLDAWLAADEKLLKDPELHSRYIPKYNGMNQSSLGYVIENPTEMGIKDVDIALLPAELFNVSSLVEWGHFKGDEEYLLHIKAALRKAISGKTIQGVPNEIVDGFVSCGRTFLSLENAMMNEGAQTL